MTIDISLSSIFGNRVLFCTLQPPKCHSGIHMQIHKRMCDCAPPLLQLSQPAINTRIETASLATTPTDLLSLGTLLSPHL